MRKIEDKLIPILIGILLIALVVVGTLFINHQQKGKTPNNEVTVYLFHASYCPHCKNALAYFKELVKDYDYLEVKAYEITSNADNRKLYKEAGVAFDKEVTSIPYIVIGDTYHETGFGDTRKKQIEEAIKEAHTSASYHDVVADLISTNPDYTLDLESIKKEN